MNGDMKEQLKKKKILIVAGIAYLIVLLVDVNLFVKGVQGTWVYLKEMIEILPAVFIITGLIDVWVSRETIMKHFGKGSGVKGKAASVLTGSVSAGPIYAAFPITQSLLRKGASVSNVVIILSAWAVVKVPMLIVEAKFLGVQFMAARYMLTIPGIIIIGLATERFVTREEVLGASRSDDERKEEVMNLLPGYNCGSCGYDNGSKFAGALCNGEAAWDGCKVCSEGSKDKLKELMG